MDKFEHLLDTAEKVIKTYKKDSTTFPSKSYLIPSGPYDEKFDQILPSSGEDLKVMEYIERLIGVNGEKTSEQSVKLQSESEKLDKNLAKEQKLESLKQELDKRIDNASDSIKDLLTSVKMRKSDIWSRVIQVINPIIEKFKNIVENEFDDIFISSYSELTKKLSEVDVYRKKGGEYLGSSQDIEISSSDLKDLRLSLSGLVDELAKIKNKLNENKDELFEVLDLIT